MNVGTAMSSFLRRLLLLFLLSESLSCHYDDIKVVLKWKNGGKGFAKNIYYCGFPHRSIIFRRSGKGEGATGGFLAG